MTIHVMEEDFDVSSEIARLRASQPNVGAVVAFVGTVREMNKGATVSTMTLEHYPGMTEQTIRAIVEQATARWALLGATVIHRIGTLQPQDQIVLVAVATTNRGAAFAACEFIMDFLKTTAPFWKKEHTSAGARWVDAKAIDDTSLNKWQTSDA